MELNAFLQRYRHLIAVGFWFIYLVTNAIVESFSVITEYARLNVAVSAWEPFVWELSSAVVTGALILLVMRADHAFPFTYGTWRRSLFAHLVATIPYSLLHVAGMVSIRKLIYAAAGSRYDFGSLATELPYEFRKDFVTYWFILGVVYLWRHVQFLNAARPVEEEGRSADEPIRRLVARKRGAEFLINTEDIHWIEASGNYANLHLESGVFPVRSSMTDLERRLDAARFARVHRSTIVNLDRIREIRPTESGDYTIRLAAGAEVRLSRRYRSALKGRFEPSS